MEPKARELRLLLACGHIVAGEHDAAAIRRILDEGIDWTSFARTALAHGMAAMAGHNLSRVAPEKVPDEILDGLLMHIQQVRRNNAALLSELSRITETLARSGIDAIALKGPALALRAYGDLGLRVFRDLDFLVRDSEMSRTMAILLDLGYRRRMNLTAAQIEVIQRLQGQEFVYNESVGVGVEPHTRLTPSKMALDVDYGGLWRRATRKTLHRRTMLVLTPEDDFIVLAIHGGKELWWNAKWVCDIAVFIDAHPDLDWAAVLDRARAQGCRRMVLLAASLAEASFHTALPERVRTSAHADASLVPLMARILSSWEADKPVGPPSNSRVSLDRLRLHDGVARRLRYVVRTLALPGPDYVAAMPLPKGLRFAYVPLKIADAVASPLTTAVRRALDHAASLKKRLTASHVGFAILLSSGEARRRYRRHEHARLRAQEALTKNPDDAAAWCSLGDALAGLERFAQALDCYDKALASTPESLNVWRRRNIALKALGRDADAEEHPPDPQDGTAWAVRAGFYFSKRRYAEAAAASDRALDFDPRNGAAMRLGVNARLWACDWHRRAEDRQEIMAAFEAGRGLVGPIDFRRMFASERDNFLAAQLWSKAHLPSETPLWSGDRYSHEKIRIAYMSADLRDHVVADTIAGCFEHHDKDRFEITAISLLRDDESRMRRRLESACDRFIDVDDMPDDEAAKTIRQLEIDILVDLNGYAGAHRTGILARRPAPVQVNYLGFPGTTAASFIDYIVADRIVIPEENRRHYTEQIVYLPYSYMPNDDRRRIADKRPSRAEAGLPEKGFVFTCHNDERKIGPEIFAAWMRLLHRVDGAVLWLKSMNPSAVANLRREAKESGVDPDRLVFAPRVPRTEDHLARLGVADLFLDTLPYNAHATACDALWAGLPVVTCRGEAFPGLVGASVLHAVGLPELVTSSLDEYETLAHELARDPARLAALKEKLARNRTRAPLFDTFGHTRDLESAYIRMWERQRAGLPPAGFDVPASRGAAASDGRGVATPDRVPLGAR
jgi:predicted O-linked N-acetylglucosamine transferase (SPINDLY family)